MSFSVLSLGWEFPPNVLGGLGVAYTALNDELSRHIPITAFIPQAESISISSSHPQQDPPPMVHPPIPEIHVAEIPVSTTSTRISYQVVYIPVLKQIDPYTTVNTLYQKVTLLEERYTTEHIMRKVWQSYPDLPAAQLPGHTTNSEETRLSLDFPEELLKQPLFNQVYNYARLALEKASDIEFDLIHAHDWMTSLAGMEIKKKFQKPLVIHVHSLEYDRNSLSKESWIYDLEKWIYHEADVIIAVSEYTRKILEEQYGIPAQRIQVIHNGTAPVSSRKIAKTFPETLILFLGRLTYQKAPELFLQIAQRVLRQNPKTRFVLAGKGEKTAELITQTSQAKMGDKVHFTGHLEREKIHELLSMTDIFVMPSISEPFGLVALEAAQFGIPCVLSRNSGAAEVLPHAFVADPQNMAEWVEIILQLSYQHALRSTVAEKQLNDLKALTWSESVEKLLEVMRTTLRSSVDDK